MGISHDQRDAFHAGQLLGRALRVAACDQNACLGMVAMDPAHGLAHFVVGGRGNGAGVEHDQAGAGGGRAGRKPFGGETGFDSGSISLGGAAAEIFYPEMLHYIYGNRSAWLEVLVIEGAMKPSAI